MTKMPIPSRRTALRLLRSLPLALMAVAAPAFAHPGHGDQAGFAAGLIHPLTGLDHLLTMLMVGLWAGLAFPKRWWVCPAAFVTFMIGGFAYGAAGGVLPVAEMLILGSLLVLGLALVFEVKPPLALAAGAIALFAVGHGFAHGSEIGAHADIAGFAAGFVTTTTLLHAAGLALSSAATRIQPRRAGQAIGLIASITATAMMWSA